MIASFTLSFIGDKTAWLSCVSIKNHLRVQGIHGLDKKYRFYIDIHIIICYKIVKR